MKKEELIAYVMNFASSIIKEKIGKDIDRIILFGSVARGDFDKESDIDVFIEGEKDIEREIENLLSIFMKSEIQKKWELKGLKNEISLKIGKLDEWELKRSIISDGILLYGKFEEFPDKMKQYVLFELKFDKFNRNKKVALWRRLYGYKQKVGNKVYLANGLVNEIGGKKINGGIIIPGNKTKEILDFLNKEKIKYHIRDIWTDNI